MDVISFTNNMQVCKNKFAGSIVHNSPVFNKNTILLDMDSSSLLYLDMTEQIFTRIQLYTHLRVLCNTGIYIQELFVLWYLKWKTEERDGVSGD